MNHITEHEFLLDDDDHLVLLINRISEDGPSNPVFLVSPTGELGFLRRDFRRDEFYQLVGINVDIVKRLRAIDDLVIVEMDGETIVHTYPASVGVAA